MQDTGCEMQDARYGMQDVIPVLYNYCASSCVIPDLIRDLKVLQACEIPAPGSESGAGRDDILALHNHFSERV